MIVGDTRGPCLATPATIIDDVTAVCVATPSDASAGVPISSHQRINFRPVQPDSLSCVSWKVASGVIARLPHPEMFADEKSSTPSSSPVTRLTMQIFRSRKTRRMSQIVARISKDCSL